ncbi:MAG: zinc ABC transporter substrate-binding protein [Halothiobacillaceae bacterium]
MLATGLLACLPASAALGAPSVVATILPVQSLAAAVTEGVTEVELLVPPGQSPHHTALRPSQMRALTSADLVIWVGPNLETAMADVIEALPQSRRLAFEGNRELTWLPARVGGVRIDDSGEEDGQAAPHGHAGHDHHDHEHVHDHRGVDPHVWLAPENAAAMVQAIADRLATVDPEHAPLYRANAERTLARLKALDRDLRKRLEPLADRPFVVFHDAYRYLEHAYGLTVAGVVSVDARNSPGVRRVAELRDRIRALGATCVFSEPQFPPRIVDTLVEGTHARVGVLDPVGADLPRGPDTYFLLLEGLGDSLATCLAGEAR